MKWKQHEHTHMVDCPQCHCVVEVPDAVCAVCGFDVAMGEQRRPGVLVGLVVAGFVLGLFFASLLVYITRL